MTLEGDKFGNPMREWDLALFLIPWGTGLSPIALSNSSGSGDDQMLVRWLFSNLSIYEEADHIKWLHRINSLVIGTEGNILVGNWKNQAIQLSYFLLKRCTRGRKQDLGHVHVGQGHARGPRDFTFLMPTPMDYGTTGQGDPWEGKQNLCDQ